MNSKTVILFGFVSILGLVTVGDGSGLGLGLLSPLLPVAQITGHAGLWAHGLSGVALLKLKAAAALGALFALSGRGIDVSLGSPDHGDHHGWGWRRRRDVSAVEAPVNTEQVVDPSFDEVLTYDKLGCGMRLVCELAGTSYDKLQDDERLILELFGRDGTKAPLPSKASKGKLTYTYASILGANAKDGADTCGRVYAECPYSRVQIMQSLRIAQI